MDEIETIAGNVREVAEAFTHQRKERQRRRELDSADFDELAKAGLLRMSVPVQYGGLWEGPAQTTRAIAEMYRVLGHGDSSVALVASMHLAVLGSWRSEKEPPTEYRDAWEMQKRWVFQTALDGAWWGTIVSEPGSGGDPDMTKAVARRGVSDGEWRISGLKHFGSGTGMASYMITTAVPEGEDERDRFVFDMRGVPLDGSAGAKLVAPWDGHGMTATQSHMVQFEDFPAIRSACPTVLLGRDGSVALGNVLWSAIILGIVETAMETGREQMGRRPSWRPYEQVEWTRAELDAWLIEQAYEGILRAVEQDGGRGTLKGKTAIAELAESALQKLCRTVGGGTYARYSPFGFWYEDVRALGFLRPPWAFAYDRLYEASWPEED